jgi:phytoene synthase
VTTGGGTAEAAADGRAPGTAVDHDAALVMARVARTFDLATRFLPAPVRTDVRRLYLVLRTLDDLVDTADPGATAAVEALEGWAAGGPPTDRETRILDALAAAHPGFPRDAVADFAAGMRADLAGPAHASAADLDRYCYQVAGTVGRMMAAVLGVRDGERDAADAGARALGAAMQRTNILRDLAEDGRAGRVYLPDDGLRAAGIDPADAAARLASFRTLPEPTRRALIAPEAARAEADYAAGIASIARLENGRRAIAAAALMYREILCTIVREEHGGRRDRAVVSRGRKLALLAEAFLGTR